MKEALGDLHILNGDCARELWERRGFAGKCLVWRETYLEGPLPDTDDLTVFRAVRAEYLSHFAELAGTTAARLERYLRKLDDAVLELSETANLRLWFDACIFDQTLLMRILWLLARRADAPPNVFLYCCEGNCLRTEDFAAGHARAARLFPDDWRIAANAWRLFRRKDADGMRRLAETGDFARLPQMRKALVRCADEAPDPDGLTRTQRQLLRLVAEGRHDFTEIFSGQAAFEECPFLGDTACRRLLDDLCGRGLLVRGPAGYGSADPSSDSVRIPAHI